MFLKMLRKMERKKIDGDYHMYEIRIEGGRQYCYCISTNNRGLQCSFRKRIDHLCSQIKNGVIHQCDFTKPINTLDKFCTHYKSSGTISESQIDEKLAYLIGRNNLPLGFCSSKELMDLINTSIQYGISLKNKGINKIEQYKSPSRDVIRNILIQQCNKDHRQIMRKFSEMTYVSISIDEGTTEKIKFLDFCLENPFYNSKPYPAHTSIMNGLKTVDYIEEISKGLKNLSKYKINVCSIIADGSLSQTKAINYIISHSKDSNIRSILLIPCLCHKIQNAFLCAIRNNSDLQSIINEIHNISKQCIDNADVIGATCPSHVNTRWIYDYEIVQFIIRFKDIVSKYSKIPDCIDELEKCLKVLKILIKKFENPKSMIGDAFALIEDGIEALNELDKRQNKFAKNIGYYLHAYTFGTDDINGLLMTAYILTPNGRKDFYRRLTDINYKKNSKDCLQKFDLIFPFDNYNSIEKEFEDPIEELTTLAIDTALQNNFLSDDIADFSEEEENNISTEENSYNVEDKVLDVTYTLDYRKGILSPAFNFMKKWISRFVADETKRKIFYSAFNNYVLTGFYDEETYLTENGCYNWLNMRTIKNMELVGDLGLRLQSTGCSEAACERIISAQRMILTSKRIRSSKELIDCRLKMMRSNSFE